VSGRERHQGSGVARRVVEVMVSSSRSSVLVVLDL
jgi:hypothetical protein